MNATLTRSKSGIDEALALLKAGHRLVSIFGTIEDDGSRHVHYLIDVDNHEYRHLQQRVDGPIPSATPITAAAAWYERELHDLYAVEIVGHPNLQPLLFHESFPRDVHPYAGRVPLPTNAPPYEYRFLKVQGDGVCEVAVGPVHAGIIEPGHFRFSVIGDTVVHLELRHFFTHKGTEAIFEGAPIRSAVVLSESVSGDNCFAHAVAYCQAVENAFGLSVPPRGRALRLIGLELERMMAHIADVGAMCGDVAFTVPAAYTARLKEALLQASTRFFGTRCWRGLATPGGMKRDLGQTGARELARAVDEVARDFAVLARQILDTPSLQNRFDTTGILSRDLARALGVVGPPARASGVRLDVRRDHPYGRYRTLTVESPHYSAGDVTARARVRIDEAAVSAQLIADALNELPAGAIATAVPAGATAEGFSAVESPRGELLYWLRIRDGQVRRCHIKSPSFQNWPALPMAMPDNIIADFPLINKSFNLSYSGCDR